MSAQTLSQDEVRLIWTQVKEELKLKISPAAFNTWVVSNPLTEIEIVDQIRAKGVISSPSAFHATNLKKNLYSQLKTSIESIMQKQVELIIQVSDPGAVLAKQKQMFLSSKKTGFHQQQTQASQTTNPSPMGSDQLQSVSSFQTPHSPTVEELFSQSTISSSIQDLVLTAVKRAGLRSDYHFKTFAVSGSNEMAHAAAMAVAKRPGQAYNPLFFYGGVGVGKTHLMQAIGHSVLERDSSASIIYCTGEEFTNEIIDAIQNKKAAGFKKRFRNAQVLLIDDIQFIAGKNAVQEEFFHTFNALTKLSSQIVITSDKSPSEINLLEDRLRSRFEAGLMVDIQQPSLELRTAIVLIKARANNLNLPINLAEKIAQKVDGARRIEGVITTIRSEVELKNKDLNELLLDTILDKEQESDSSQKIRLRPQRVMKEVCSFYQVSQAAIKGKRRQKELVSARHMAMYLLKQDLGLSYVEIGRWFSNRDHTSVMHAKDKVQELIEKNELTKREYQQIKNLLLKKSS